MQSTSTLILCLIFLIFPIECERRALKMDNCSVNDKIAEIKRCDLADGKVNTGFNIIVPQNEFFVSSFGRKIQKYMKIQQKIFNSRKSLQISKFSHNINSKFHLQLMFCVHKCEDKKFIPVGKCQTYNHCDFIKNVSNRRLLNPFVSKIIAFWKFSKVTIMLKPCPVSGSFELSNLDINVDFLTFLPKGILRWTTKAHNGREMIFLNKVIFMNN